MSPRLPRVLVSGVVLGQPMGGVRRHNAELLPRAARVLAAGGGSLSVLVGREGLAFTLPESVELLRSSVPSGPPLARALLEGRALEQALAGARATGIPFDLVHLGHLPAPRRLSIPFTLTLHDLRSVALAHTPFSRRFVARHVLGRAVRDARCVLCVSETVERQVAGSFQPARLARVPNAADHLRVRTRSPALDAPILHVGHVERRKNLELLVRALALDSSLPALVCAGAARHGEDERLRALARDLCVAERVHFRGPFDEARLPELYATCACVALPSLLEGFGIVALEAQRARAPLAISAAGALPEVAGVDVPCFPVDDPLACAAAIRRAIARSPLELEQDAARAARFTWDDSATRLVAAWTEAAGPGLA